MLKALILDVDGTLADTEQDGHRVAFNHAFADGGHEWHWDVPTYGRWLDVAGGKQRLSHFLQTVAPELLPSERADLVASLHARKTEHYLRLMDRGGILLRPGVARLLAAARDNGMRLAIATTTTRANVDALLQRSLPDSANLFSVVGAADDAQRMKPDPEIYQVVLEQLRLAPNECLAIEDSKAGLRAALAAGIPTVVTVNHYTRMHDFEGALAVVSDLGEPDAPAQSIAGAALRGPCVDLAQLVDWHQAVSGV
jgi:HAD superfamily hydrolase (TIGR01509 family)